MSITDILNILIFLSEVLLGVKRKNVLLASLVLVSKYYIVLGCNVASRG